MFRIEGRRRVVLNAMCRRMWVLNAEWMCQAGCDECWEMGWLGVCRRRIKWECSKQPSGVRLVFRGSGDSVVSLQRNPGPPGSNQATSRRVGGARHIPPGRKASGFSYVFNKPQVPANGILKSESQRLSLFDYRLPSMTAFA